MQDLSGILRNKNVFRIVLMLKMQLDSLKVILPNVNVKEIFYIVQVQMLAIYHAKAIYIHNLIQITKAVVFVFKILLTVLNFLNVWGIAVELIR